jgi:hypothetical protein
VTEGKKAASRQESFSASVEEFRDSTESIVRTAEAKRGLQGSRRAVRWCKGPATIDGAEVVLDEGEAAPYWMFLPSDVVFDLAELAEVPGMIPTFVRRYGMLWHGASDLGTNQCRELLEDWFKEIDALRATLGLYHRLGEAVDAGSSAPLRQGEFAWHPEFVEHATDADFFELASLQIAYSVTARLEDCKLGLVSTMELKNVAEPTPTAFRLSHNPPNLLTAVYERLALLVSGRATVTECPGCGRLFAPESGKQKYHSPSCASTTRWRRWKEKQAE